MILINSPIFVILGVDEEVLGGYFPMFNNFQQNLQNALLFAVALGAVYSAGVAHAHFYRRLYRCATAVREYQL